MIDLKININNLLNSDEKDNFNENLKIIHKQINQIENLVNEFSDFARMPKPIFKKNKFIKYFNSKHKIT